MTHKKWQCSLSVQPKSSNWSYPFFTSDAANMPAVSTSSSAFELHGMALATAVAHDHFSNLNSSDASTNVAHDVHLLALRPGIRDEQNNC